MQVGGSARLIGGKLANAGILVQHVPARCLQGSTDVLAYFRKMCINRNATHVIVWGIAFVNFEPFELFL
eukprot:5226832-Amphidinium_carterae.1